MSLEECQDKAISLKIGGRLQVQGDIIGIEVKMSGIALPYQLPCQEFTRDLVKGSMLKQANLVVMKM